jgi:hypothetical protein
VRFAGYRPKLVEESSGLHQRVSESTGFHTNAIRIDALPKRGAGLFVSHTRFLVLSGRSAPSSDRVIHTAPAGRKSGQRCTRSVRPGRAESASAAEYQGR